MEKNLGRGVWRKSSYSGQAGNCVEVADAASGIVAMRDSKDPNGPVLVLAAGAWRMMACRVKAGELA
jgi:hypothetical protein